MTYIRHISAGINETLAEIKKRREGSALFIPTGISKLDNTLYGGLEPGRILTIAGLSGTGKSLFLENIKDNLFINSVKKGVKLKVLDFSFEMLLKDSLLRVLSKRTSKTLAEIFKDYVDFKDTITEIKSREQYVIDQVVTIDEMETIITDFCKEQDEETFTVITIDHTLLTKSKTSEIEKVVIDQLYHMLVRLKMKFNRSNTNVSFLVLSQLNRDIESKDRILNSSLHYPNKNDIFAASSVYYSSDYVWILHCPANIPGIKSYGPSLPNFPMGLPVKLGANNTKVIYLHCIKNRFGVPNKIVPFLEEFQYSRVNLINIKSDTEYEFPKV
jgi:replicative DNA helicase